MEEKKMFTQEHVEKLIQLAYMQGAAAALQKVNDEQQERLDFYRADPINNDRRKNND